MTDRLAELTGTAPDSTTAVQDGRRSDIDVEQLGEELDAESKEALQKFQTEADAISLAIRKLQDTVVEIEQRYKITLSCKGSTNGNAQAQQDISRMIQDNENRSEAIRKRLRRIAGENKEFSAAFPSKTGQLRVRVNTHQGLTKRFMASMQSFEVAQEKHRNNVREAMERQLEQMTGAAHDEIREAVRSGQSDNFVENSPMMAQLAPEEQRKLRNGLADLKSRNMDIKKLEESIVKLHQLFMDMQVLVESQGELLNNIEYNVEETKGAAIAAHQELEIALNHQKSANKKKWIIGGLILVIAAVIIVPLLIKFIPRGNSSSQNGTKVRNWAGDRKTIKLDQLVLDAT